MKKYFLLTLTIVLTAAMFTACGCTDQDAMYTTAPTTRPTSATTAPSTMPTTRPTTEATTESTIDRGNGALESTESTANTTNSTEQTQEGRTRQVQPSTNSR